MRIVHRIILFLPMLGLLVMLAACAGAAAEMSGARVGVAAPPLALPALGGKTVQLADYRGKVVIVNFWASWCPPCINETPRLVNWSEQYKQQGLAVLGVAQIFRDSQAKVAAFAADKRVSYPIPLDTDGKLSEQWQVGQFLPRSYVIDREGVVRFVQVGELTERIFEQQVLPLLK